MNLRRRIMNDFINIINGFRKYSVMMLVIATATTFRITDHINGAEFVDLLKGTVIAFVSANSLEHMSKSIIEWVKQKKGG